MPTHVYTAKVSPHKKLRCRLIRRPVQLGGGNCSHYGCSSSYAGNQASSLQKRSYFSIGNCKAQSSCGLRLGLVVNKNLLSTIGKFRSMGGREKKASFFSHTPALVWSSAKATYTRVSYQKTQAMRQFFIYSTIFCVQIVISLTELKM
jgi:hypothetical protein